MFFRLKPNKFKAKLTEALAKKRQQQRAKKDFSEALQNAMGLTDSQVREAAGISMTWYTGQYAILATNKRFDDEMCPFNPSGSIPILISLNSHDKAEARERILEAIKKELEPKEAE